MSSAAASSSNSRERDDHRWPMQLHELFEARLSLAQLEVRHDINSARRLGIVAGIGAVLALTGLPLLVSVLSQALAVWTLIDVFWWQLALGSGLALLGAAMMFAGWRTFRRDFSGLRETLDELREDRVWLSEITAETIHNAGVARSTDAK